MVWRYGNAGRTVFVCFSIGRELEREKPSGADSFNP